MIITLCSSVSVSHKHFSQHPRLKWLKVEDRLTAALLTCNMEILHSEIYSFQYGQLKNNLESYIFMPPDRQQRAGFHYQKQIPLSLNAQ